MLKPTKRVFVRDNTAHHNAACTEPQILPLYKRETSKAWITEDLSSICGSANMKTSFSVAPFLTVQTTLQVEFVKPNMPANIP